MKPFITPDVLPDGSRMYSAQCEGLQLVEMPGCVLNREIIAYYLPGKQSLSAAWIFRLAFDNSFALEFSSACTMIDGWNEVGSINVKLIDFANQGDSSLDAILMRFDIRPFRVTSLAKLLFEGKNFSSECGIVFEGGGARNFNCHRYISWLNLCCC